VASSRYKASKPPRMATLTWLVLSVFAMLNWVDGPLKYDLAVNMVIPSISATSLRPCPDTFTVH
jgi:hypothetical protein